MPRPYDWIEHGDGVFSKRYESLDLNVGAVVCGDGVLVVDTRAHHGQARDLLADLRRITPHPVRWVVNTHHHWDHTFGNAVLLPAAIWGHERCALALRLRGEQHAPGGQGVGPGPGRPVRRGGDHPARPHLRPVGPAHPGRPHRRAAATWGGATPTTTSWPPSPTPGCCSPATWSRRAALPPSATPSPWSGPTPPRPCSPWRPGRWCPATARSWTGPSSPPSRPTWPRWPASPWSATPWG